jgi:flavin reductase (DIM6/NTAB) family NADH-FMN oxidoreductase RutF
MPGELLDIITSPVTVVTTKYNDRLNGMTVAWIAQVSLNPTLIMVSIAPPRYTHELITKSNIFAVNVLAHDQVDVGKHFGFSSGRKIDKFAGIDYETKKTGAPILKECFAYLDCKVHTTAKAGDHTIFVGAILDYVVRPGKKPLLFRSGDFF